MSSDDSVSPAVGRAEIDDDKVDTSAQDALAEQDMPAQLDALSTPPMDAPEETPATASVDPPALDDTTAYDDAAALDAHAAPHDRIALEDAAAHNRVALDDTTAQDVAPLDDTAKQDVAPLDDTFALDDTAPGTAAISDPPARAFAVDDDAAIEARKSPARADRRVRQGLRLTTTFGAGVVALAIVPAAACLAALLVYPPAPPPPAIVRHTVDFTSVETTLDAAERQENAAREALVTVTQEKLALAALLNTAIVGREIAIARDVRRNDGARGEALARPFSATELSGLKTHFTLEDENTGTVVVGRDGTRIFGTGELPDSIVKAPSRGDVDAMNVVTDDMIFSRACVENEKVCVIERAPKPIATTSFAEGRAAIATAKTAVADVEVSAPATLAPADRHQRQLLTAFIALVLALIGAVLLLRKLKNDVTEPLRQLQQRAQLIAQGQTTGDHAVTGVAEVEDVDTGLDAIAAAMQTQRDALAAVDVKHQRLLDLADVLDAIAHGTLGQRAVVQGSVAEQALATATNRLAESLERHAARLRSHLDVLEASTENGAPAMAKRVSALRPMPPLLADIGARLLALGAQPTLDDTVRRDLSRLGEAVAQRAKTAQSLFAALERDVGQSTSADATPALERLLDDLRMFSQSPALPALVFALGTGPTALTAPEIAARVTSALTSPPGPR